MSRDTKPFVPPVRYPSPPKNMWYKVPGVPPAPPADRPPPIFPWEKKQHEAPRVLTHGESEVPPVGQASRDMPPGEPEDANGPRALAESSVIESAREGSKSEPQTPIIKSNPSNPWMSFPRLNAWDHVPEIGRYVEGLQKHRRAKSQGAAFGSPDPGFAVGNDAKPRVMMRLTDFPSEAERPSLPVTPAPVRRSSYFGEEASDSGQAGSGNQPLPAAEGVPAQTEWVCVHGRRWGPADCPCNSADVGKHRKDPAEQLQKLAKQQSEALLRKLGGEAQGPPGTASREIPSRPLPFGSDKVKPAAFVAHSLPPSVLSPQPVKREVSAAGMETMAAVDAPGGRGETMERLVGRG